MDYSFQTYSVGQVLTAAAMNQEEVNIRDHIHGVAGVGNSWGADIVPTSHAVYNLGSTSYYWANAYFQNFPTLPYAAKVAFFEDFDGNVAHEWGQLNTQGAATFSAGSRGVFTMTTSGNNSPETISMVNYLRLQRADWGSIKGDMLAAITTAQNTAIEPTIGFIDPTTSPNSGSGAFWQQVASAAMAPRTRDIGAGTTTGNSLAWPTG